MLEIYCDGACSGNPGPGGWGVYIKHNDQVIELKGNEKDTTNNKMEMMAFYTSLNYIFDNNETGTIYTDSNYVYQTIVSWHKNWKRTIDGKWYKGKHEEIKNLELWLIILELYHKIEDMVTIVKVKGHSDNYGNIVADQLAVLARKELDK